LIGCTINIMAAPAAATHQLDWLKLSFIYWENYEEAD
jgi:hypothetical protein